MWYHQEMRASTQEQLDRLSSYSSRLNAVIKDWFLLVYRLEKQYNE